jgi:hypothetical protein
VLICSVGTELFYRAGDGSYQPDCRWREQLDAQGRWDRGQVEQVAAGFQHLSPQVGRAAAGLGAVLALRWLYRLCARSSHARAAPSRHPALPRPQQASEQRPHKLSYHLDVAAVGDAGAYIGRLEAALRAAALDVRVVYSGGRDVDLLAAGADKGRALAFLLQQIPAACQPPLGCQVGVAPLAGMAAAGPAPNRQEAAARAGALPAALLPRR